MNAQCTPRPFRRPSALPTLALVVVLLTNTTVADSLEQPITIQVAPVDRGLNRDLARAHQLLQDKALEPARTLYEKARRTEPDNIDILLGLAIIAEQQGQVSEAEGWRQRAVESDPLNPDAQAARLGSEGNDAANTESRLKILIGQHPATGALHFALGNLYARQARWADAQQAYFNALALDTGNPDFLFNLAVSLDHLRQERLAVHHYRLALEAAQRRPPAFHPGEIERRLRELMP